MLTYKVDGDVFLLEPVQYLLDVCSVSRLEREDGLRLVDSGEQERALVINMTNVGLQFCQDGKDAVPSAQASC